MGSRSNSARKILIDSSFVLAKVEIGLLSSKSPKRYPNDPCARRSWAQRKPVVLQVDSVTENSKMEGGQYLFTLHIRVYRDLPRDQPNNEESLIFFLFYRSASVDTPTKYRNVTNDR